MFIEALIQIGILAVCFFICGLVCYCLCTYLLKEEGKNYVKPETVAWERKHYYDPLPTSRSSPPDALCQPTVYSFKVSNGTHAQPHAVINPAVLQFPPPPGQFVDKRHTLPNPISPDPQIKGFRNSPNKLPTIDLKTYGFKGKSPKRNGGLGIDSEGWIA